MLTRISISGAHGSCEGRQGCPEARADDHREGGERPDLGEQQRRPRSRRAEATEGRRLSSPCQRAIRNGEHDTSTMKRNTNLVSGGYDRELIVCCRQRLFAGKFREERSL